ETLLVTFFHEQGHEMEPYLLEQDIKDNYFYHELQLCNDAMFDIRDLKMLGIRDFKNCYHYQPSELFADTYAYQMIHYYGFDNHLKANQIKKLLLDEKIDNDSLYRQMILYLIINEAELKNKTISEVYREFQLKKGKYQNVERKFIKKFICH
ncbi:MAG: hypothetical protein KH135_01485, partial [Firmicutes bacterium]|nr:hypothetical protein [Bacillota bacterium]